MRYPKNILLLILLFLQLDSLACLNEARILLDGKILQLHDGNEQKTIPIGKDIEKNKPAYEAKLKELKQLYQSNQNLADYSDCGVVLCYLGRYEEAKNIFLEIEKRSPGLYATAANLGTTYELLGKNELALEWIKKAVKINPTSHQSSEWIHINILKAKIKGNDAINSTFLLGVDFGDKKTPVSTKSLEELESLQKQLYFQLSERLTFIKPTDKIMGLLLYELGNITSFTHYVAPSLDLYNIAKEYGYDSPILEKRYKEFEELNRNSDELNGVKRGGRRIKITKPDEPLISSQESHIIKDQSLRIPSNTLSDNIWIAIIGAICLFAIVSFKLSRRNTPYQP